MIPGFRRPAPNPNLNAAKTKLSTNISNYARAVNAHKRAVMSPDNKTPEQISNLNKITRNKRALAMNSLNMYLNKVIQANVNKFQTAQSEKTAATAAANATLAARVLSAVKKAGIANPNQPTQANVNKFRTVINKVSKGGLGSRMIGTTRITNNMVQPLKNTLGTMISRLGATEQAGAEARGIEEIRKRYTNLINGQLSTGLSTNGIIEGILATRRNSNANRNLKTLIGNNKYSQYFRNANSRPSNASSNVNKAANLLYRRSHGGLAGTGLLTWKANVQAGQAVLEMASIVNVNKNAVRAALNNATKYRNRSQANRAKQIINKIGTPSQ